MSRKAAEELFTDYNNMNDQMEIMKDIVMSDTFYNVIDELPGAYKNIDEVIENEKDLVDIIMKLKPIANIKAPSEKRRK